MVFFIAFLMLIASCEKEPYSNLGFDSPIDINSNGLVIAHISQNDERIYLTGVVSVSEGEVLVNLIDPDGVVAYSKTIIAPVELQINETIGANQGYWKLKYKSNKGIGTIDLHLYK